MKKLIILLTAAVFTVSCSSDLEDLNKNTKDPVEVSGESLFASAQKRLTDQMITPNVNSNNTRLWVQHWQETTYPDESNYDQVTRSIPDNHWRVMYKDVLNNLREAAEVIASVDLDLTNSQKPNKLAIIEILSVYAYSNLVETYGNIPYTEALDIENLLPKYDDAKTVYVSLIERLDTAILSMDSSGSFNGTDDLIYAGNAENWRKFGNTLKLRMGIMLADADPVLSKKTVESAYSAGVFQSNADDANYAYGASAPNNNPLNDNLVLSGRNDYVAGKTIIDIMNTLQDPRRTNYFDPNLSVEIGKLSSVNEAGATAILTFEAAISKAPIVGNNAYTPSGNPEIPTLLGTITEVGANTMTIAHVANLPEAGEIVLFAEYKGATIGQQSRYADFSHANRSMVESTLPGGILSYIEAKFLLAEAAARGYAVGSVETHYAEAINASFELWESTGVADYLAKPEVDYATALANSKAATPWKEVIGTQAWLGLYNNSFAPYLSVRRLDYPILVKPDKNDSGFPVRYTYPVNEQNLNGGNYGEAASAIGGDKAETLLFWDREYTFGF